MALFKRIDSFDVAYADSFADPALKVQEVRVHRDGSLAKKGVGEKRIYCGHNEEQLNDFFRFDQDPIFFLQKDDLEEYSKSIEGEYLNPHHNYGDSQESIYEIWKSNRDKLNSLTEERLYLKFTYKYDDQNRYYINFPKRCSETIHFHKNWDYLREVCLPKVSRLLFVKLIDIETEKLYIYIKPIFVGFDSTPKKIEDIRVQRIQEEKGEKTKGPKKYREQVYNRYSYCVVTKVTDPNLLIACHIKKDSFCNENEIYDKYNGFMMTPTISSLFDMGYMTFDTEGKMILSDFFRNNDRRCLNLFCKNIKVPLTKEMIPYIQWHNENVFIKTSRGVQIVSQE